jgi:hypothetical protein
VVTNNWHEDRIGELGWCPEPYSNLACWQAGLFIDDYENP